MNPFEIPIGWKFHPEDRELIENYLYKKVRGLKLPSEGIIVNCDLYGKENPWEIWERFSEYVVKTSHCEDLYVFTQLKRKSPKAKKVVRKVGLGSWEGEARERKITTNNSFFIAITTNNSDNVNESEIGFMKRFRFEKSGTHHDGRWIMHEYSLHPLLIRDRPHLKDHVVCRIRKNGTTVKLQKEKKEPLENQQKYHEKQKDYQKNKKIRIEPIHIEKRISEDNKNIQIIPPANIENDESDTDEYCSYLETFLSTDGDQGEKKYYHRNKKRRIEPRENIEKRISEDNKNNQIIPPANIKNDESDTDEYCSYLETYLSTGDDQGEQKYYHRNKKRRIEPRGNIEKRIFEGNKNNQIIPPANIENDESDTDEYCSYLEAYLSTDGDQGEKNGDELLKTPTSNKLDNVKLFLRSRL